MGLLDVQFLRAAMRRTFVLSLVTPLLLTISPSATGQTYRVIHTFTGAADGSTPNATMITDQGGSLYGTASYGGAQLGFAGSGVVFKLAKKNSSWVLSPLYTFQGGTDGAYPGATLAIGADSRLYGTTSLGGNPGCAAGSCGIVYQLAPPLTPCRAVRCPWTKIVLYRFSTGLNGSNPGYGQLVFDHAGNIYGTTGAGGNANSGVVYELSHSGTGWQEAVLHSFGGMGDGLQPQSGVVFDSESNLYSTTVNGGAQGKGSVFELSPSGSGWVISEQHDIANEGTFPYAGVILDQLGNVYGATSQGGPGNGGTIFQLTTAGGQWSSNIIGTFSPLGGQGLGPMSSLTMDVTGTLYGTTGTDGVHGFGSVFKLVPQQDGSWVQTTLYDFTGASDGCNPGGGVTLAPDGHLYGTTQGCGAGYGVVWEIAP